MEEDVFILLIVPISLSAGSLKEIQNRGMCRCTGIAVTRSVVNTSLNSPYLVNKELDELVTVINRSAW